MSHITSTKNAHINTYPQQIQAFSDSASPSKNRGRKTMAVAQSMGGVRFLTM